MLDSAIVDRIVDQVDEHLLLLVEDEAGAVLSVHQIAECNLRHQLTDVETHHRLDVFVHTLLLHTCQGEFRIRERGQHIGS